MSSGKLDKQQIVNALQTLPEILQNHTAMSDSLTTQLTNLQTLSQECSKINVTDIFAEILQRLTAIENVLKTMGATQKYPDYSTQINAINAAVDRLVAAKNQSGQ